MNNGPSPGYQSKHVETTVTQTDADTCINWTKILQDETASKKRR